MSPRQVLRVCSFVLLFVCGINFRSVQGQDPSAANAAPSSVAPSSAATAPQSTPAMPKAKEAEKPPVEETPWEYRPYNVKLWMVSTDPALLESVKFNQKMIAQIDLSVRGAWSLEQETVPARYEGLMLRDFDTLNYEQLSGEDLILIVNANNEVGRPIRTPQLAAGLPHKIPCSQSAARRLQQAAVPELKEFVDHLEPVDEGTDVFVERWVSKSIYAMVIPRSLLLPLIKKMPPGTPAPRVIDLPLIDQFIDVANRLDKLFMVRVKTDQLPYQVNAIELDGLLRACGPVSTHYAYSLDDLSAAGARACLEAFAPVVRIEDAGTKTAKGRVRAEGLVLDEASPIKIRVGETLQPWLRKDDRTGKPTMLGPLDWTYGIVKSLNGSKLEMDVFSGRSGGLQGKTSRRMYRVALRVRKEDDPSVLRLHARGNPDSPMSGYEVYEKNLKSGLMTLVGRTDWDGRYLVEHTEDPIRLLYIKNGGSVLARLPMVPGLMPIETADLVSDDTRLRAEAYLKGVENSIIDLVALRQLYATRIRSRIARKQVADARTLFEELRQQPSYKIIADDMNLKQQTIQSANKVEQRKIDGMFAKTRELLVAQLTDKLINDLQKEVSDAEAGKFPEPVKKST